MGNNCTTHKNVSRTVVTGNYMNDNNKNKYISKSRSISTPDTEVSVYLESEKESAPVVVVDEEWALCELASNLCKEGDSASNGGDYETALTKYKQMLHIPERMTNSPKAGRHITQIALASMAKVNVQQQNFNDALFLYEQSLSIAHELDNRRAEALILLRLARVHKDLRRYKKALEYSNDAVTIFHEIDNKNEEALALQSTGEILHKLRKYDLSKQKYKQSRMILRAINHNQDVIVEESGELVQVEEQSGELA